MTKQRLYVVWWEGKIGNKKYRMTYFKLDESVFYGYGSVRLQFCNLDLDLDLDMIGVFSKKKTGYQGLKVNF
jgi:hypothetical protein